MDDDVARFPACFVPMPVVRPHQVNGIADVIHVPARPMDLYGFTGKCPETQVAIRSSLKRPGFWRLGSLRIVHADLRGIGSAFFEKLRSKTMFLFNEAQEQMLGSDVRVRESLGFIRRPLQNVLRGLA